MIRDIASLLRARDAGEPLQFLYFWGHRSRRGRPPGKEVLSQWYMASFTHDGVHYASAEHWMMAEKARLFGDDAALQAVLAAPTPAAAKKEGRQVAGFSPEGWAAHCVDIVVRGNVLKFAQNPALLAYLLSTGPLVLVEAAPNDAIWGIGMAQDAEGVGDPRRWRGTNLLGFALMEARHRLARPDPPGHGTPRHS